MPRHRWCRRERAIENNNGRIWFAQMLRAVACLAVVYAHLGWFFWRHNAALEPIGIVRPLAAPRQPIHIAWHDSVFGGTAFIFGPFGVALFFLISGFVIPLSLDGTRPVVFLMRRMLRIYPVYIVGLALTCGALMMYWRAEGTGFRHSASSVIANALLVRDWVGAPTIDHVNWTLELEWKFYFLCAVMAALGSLGKARTVLAAAAFCLVYCGTGSLVTGGWPPSSGPLSRIATNLACSLAYLPFFLIGTAFQLRFRRTLSRLEFAGCVGVLAAAWLASVRFTPLAATGWQTYLQSYLPALAVFAVCFALREALPYSRSLDRLADISFPLYVVHGVNGYILLTVLHPHIGNAYLGLAATMAIVLAASIAIHWWVERPGNRLAKLLFPPAPTPSATVAITKSDTTANRLAA